MFYWKNVSLRPGTGKRSVRRSPSYMDRLPYRDDWERTNAKAVRQFWRGLCPGGKKSAKGL